MSHSNGAPPSVTEVTVSLPALERSTPGGYVKNRIDCKLSPRQANALANLTHALDADQARTKDTRRVVNIQDAVRWWLDALADAQEEAGLAL